MNRTAKPQNQETAKLEVWETYDLGFAEPGQKVRKSVTGWCIMLLEKWLGFDMEKIIERTNNKFDLEDRLIEFSVMVISVTESLPETRTCAHLGGQLLRSGTSAALNYGEAQGAESRKDFVHKIKLILKELRESRICLRILSRRSHLQSNSVLNECNELVAIFTKSVKTASSPANKDR